MSFDQLTFGDLERLNKPTTIRQRFERFHDENPVVWQLFRRFTLEAISNGAKKVGARLIWERMRWHVKFETTEHDFKLNDHYIAHYARKFLKQYPAHEGLFELRAIKEGEQ